MNFTEADAAAAFRNIEELYSTNTIEPFGEAAAFAGQADQNMKWINGKVGMIVDYTGSAPKYIASIDSPLEVLFRSLKMQRPADQSMEATADTLLMIIP